MSQNHNDSHHTHHILPVKLAVKILLILMFLTVVTVLTAKFVNLGPGNFPLAMAIATTKALLVVLFFMGLKYDSNDNRLIFFGSFIFVGIFFVLTASDILFRGNNWRAKKGEFATMVKGGASKFKQPWKQSPELVAHGKAVFQSQCAMCHGAEGKGDGVAGQAMNPHPRNFTQTTGWKKARKVTNVFETVTNGLPGTSMSAFGTLPSDDRWGVAHYVLSLAGGVESDSDADFKRIGVDPNSDGGGASEKPTLPTDFAIERMAE